MKVSEQAERRTASKDKEGANVNVRQSSSASALQVFMANKLAVGAVLALLVVAMFSFLGPLLYHTNQTATNLTMENLPPGPQHILGTSPTGKDELGRLMVGGQSTLEVGLAVGLLSTGFGLIWGTIAGYVGGAVDALMMRVVDAALSIPFLFFAVLLAAVITPSVLLIIFVISAVSWLSTARLVRGETLKVRTYDFVAASKGFGTSNRSLITRHIAPNVLGTLIVNGTLKVADAILIFASLGYLGLGVAPPATNWGATLAAGVNNIFNGYWWQLWPAAIMIIVTVLSVNVLGDGLRDVVERRLARS